MFAPLALFGSSGSWNVDSDGNWDVNGNWTGATYPDGTTQNATLGNVITADRVITLPGGNRIDVRTITFNDDNQYTITGGNFDFNLAGNAFTQSGSGAVVIDSNIRLINSQNWTGNGTGIVTINGVISDNGGTDVLTKNGTFTLVLNAANSTDGMTINAGTVEFGNNAANGDGTLTLNGGTIRAGGGAITINEAVTAGGSFTVGGSNDLTLSGNMALTGNRTVTVDNTGTTTFSGVVSGGGDTLTKDGNGVLVLSGNNTYSGGLTVNAGTVGFGNNGANGTGTLTLNGGTIRADGGARTLNEAVTVGGNFTVGGSNDLTLSGNMNWGGTTRTITVDNTGNTSLTGVLSGTAGFTKDGTGTLTVGGAGSNTISGTVTINEGTLQTDGTPVNGTFDNSVSIVIGDGIGGIGADVLRLSLDGDIGNDSPIRINSSGELNYGPSLIETIGHVTMEGGRITGEVAGNTMQLGTAPVAGVTTLAHSQTAEISVANLNFTTNTRTFDIAEGSAAIDLDVSSIISGNAGVGMVKDGAGLMRLSGSSANTFTGSTTISAGTLDLNKTGALGSTSSVVVNSTGTLLFTGSSTDRVNDSAGITLAGGTISANSKTETMGSLTLSANSVIDLVADASTGVLTFAGGSLVGAPTLTINNWQGTALMSGTDDQIFMTAGPGATFLNSIFFTGYGWGAVRLGSGEIVPIPEPGTYAAGALVVLLIGVSTWRRHAAARQS